jgi:hypothetical protein
VTPPALPLTAAEPAVIAAHRTPLSVQRWPNALPSNTEKNGETLRSFRGVVRTGKAHCLEAALSAEALLHREGRSGNPWRLLDYGAVIVHVFHPEARDFYALDRLYGDAPQTRWRAAAPARPALRTASRVARPA